MRCEEWNAARAAARAARPRPEGKRGRPAKGELPPEEVRALEEEAASIKGSRYALGKNPEDLTDGQRARLEALKKRAGSRLVRAWELKEDLRAVFRAADGSEAAELLDDWMHRAAYCKIAKVVAVEKKVRRRDGTVKNLAHFSGSLISPPSGAATPPAESRPDSASSPTRSRPRT